MQKQTLERFANPFFLLILTAVLLSPTPLATAAKPEGKAHHYKQVGDRKLTVYVTKPSDWAKGQTRPAIVFYHGGGWVGGAPGQFTEHSKYFASRGIVCFQVEYRLLNRSNNEPPTKCIEDAKSAMRWIRSRSAQFGIDPKRIASAGGSAGGHLAAFVGTTDGVDSAEDDLSISAKSNAMLLFNPVYNNGPGGWGTKRVGENYQQFSPAHNLTRDDPPCIVFLGDQDQLIPVSTAEQFNESLTKVGVKSELVIYKGQGHGFFNHGRSENKFYKSTVVACDRFLESLGWLQGPPTLAD